MIKFDYTKADGSVSSRIVVKTTGPEANQCGIDVTTMDPDLAALFEQEYLDMVSQFKLKVADLMRKFDIEHNYRQFKPSGMSNVKNV